MIGGVSIQVWNIHQQMNENKRVHKKKEIIVVNFQAFENEKGAYFHFRNNVYVQTTITETSTPIKLINGKIPTKPNS